MNIQWLTPLPPTPPLACGSNSSVSSLLGVSRRHSGLAPAPPPGKEEPVELLPHANGGIGGVDVLA